MTDERWAKVWDVFRDLRDLPPEERSSALDTLRLAPDVLDEALALLEASTSYATQKPTAAALPTNAEYTPGREFGRYVIVGHIGQGGFGSIYAARDKELRRTVALKVLSGLLPENGERLIEEARAASALNHPNIVTVFETIAADGHLAIAMELVDGPSLRQMLNDQQAPLPVEKTVQYGRQIAQALAAAHEAGIAHRDVKPENLLLRKDGYIKLVDFGLATSLIPQTQDKTYALAGTMRYMSPEQLQGEQASPASDVFSLGLVLYEMATGAHPFRGDSPLDTAAAIVARKPIPPSRAASRIPAKLDRLIVTMLSKNAGDRPTAAEVTKSLLALEHGPGRRWGARLAWATVVLAGTAAALSFVLPRWSHTARALAIRLDSRPLTGEEGRETKPALSPDGRYVAYHWQNRAGGKTVTRVREIDSERTTLLPIAGPFSWLPDNQRIGFVRPGGVRDALRTIRRDGTDEETILEAKQISHFEWSPSGEWIVYQAIPGGQNPSALFVYSTRSRESRQITFPPATTYGDEDCAISPDGKYVAFWRTVSHVHADLLVTSFPVSRPPRTVAANQRGRNTLVWVRDGSALISSTSRGATYSLWLYPADGKQTPSRLTETGMQARDARGALERNRLVWTNVLEDTNIWSVPLAGGNPGRVVASTMLDNDINSSSLGLLAFRSDRSGFSEVWIAGKSGDSQRKVTNLENFTGSPRWSPDGHRLAFDSQSVDMATKIFVMDCDPAGMQCGPPVQVTHHLAADALPNWSVDGTHLYFASQRTGQWQVWKTPANSVREQAVQVTTQGGYLAFESPDRKWLYYSRIDGERVMGVWRKPLSGTTGAGRWKEDPGELLLPLEYPATATWVLSDTKIFYETFGSESGPPAGLWEYDLATRQKKLIYSASALPLSRGLALSSDGKSLLYARTDRSESNIVVADYEIMK